MEIKTGKIISAIKHPEANKSRYRGIVSGIANNYSPQELKNKIVVVLKK